jgi:1,4-alpha-glucan branching enzyme
MTLLPAESRPAEVVPRRSKQPPIHLVDFFCHANGAKAVFLAGDFNEWDPLNLPMTRMPDGGWVLRMPLSHGHHQYFFVVDGKPVLDPKSVGTVLNARHQRVSLVAVS